jgi:predicted DNA-binding protein
MKRVATHITEQQHAALKELSAKTGLAVADLVRRAIDEYLSRSK